MTQASEAPSPCQSSTLQRICLNRHGFLPDAKKIATCRCGDGTFRVLERGTGRVVHSGNLVPTSESSLLDGAEFLKLADFSLVETYGEFELEIHGADEELHAYFRIHPDSWNAVFSLSMHAMTLWRCGCGVHMRWHGETFSHPACHIGEALLDHVGEPPGTKKSALGGWHDAGDYNKYSLNGAFSAGLILKGWEHFRDRIEKVPLRLPDSESPAPACLAEVKYELDWLLRMQLGDGKISHKVSALDFSYWGPPEKDPQPQFFCPWGTASTAAFAAVMAQASRIFREWDPAWARDCLDASLQSWRCLLMHPGDVDPDQSAFQTGPYTTKDFSYRLWAAAEIFRTTGDLEVLDWFCEAATGSSFSHLGPLWQDATDLALGTFLESTVEHRLGEKLQSTLKEQLAERTSEIIQMAGSHPFGRPLGSAPGTWFWGDNGSVAAQTYLLQLQHRLAPDPQLRLAAQDSLSHLLGRNFHGRSYVTGLGHEPPRNPHDRRGGAWPGYLVGGPWPSAADWFDETGDFRTNEIAVNWNASLIYASAGFVEPTGTFPEFE